MDLSLRVEFADRVHMRLPTPGVGSTPPPGQRSAVGAQALVDVDTSGPGPMKHDEMR